LQETPSLGTEKNSVRGIILKKVAVFTFILIFLVLVGVVGSKSFDKRNLDLEKTVYSLVEDINNTEIHINSVTNFNWDKAFLFEPYSGQEILTKEIGVNYKDSSNIAMRDDIYLLVFLNESKVVHYAEIKRQGCSFSIGENKYLTPANDLLKISRH
jgi:hypothetical protein